MAHVSPNFLKNRNIAKIPKIIKNLPRTVAEEDDISVLIWQGEALKRKEMERERRREKRNHNSFII